jgi:Leucine-rich repeat (LRR) protein
VDPRPIDPQVVAAWKAAGIRSGWQTAYQVFDTKPDFKHYPELLPYFAIAEWQPGLLAKLPPPDVPFSLTLHGAGVLDSHLQELAGLKNLRKLNLNVNFKLTGIGFKHLAPLDLRQLFVYQTVVSDAGLSEICEIKTLRELSIGGNSMLTDEGLRHLSKLRRLQVLEMAGVKISDVGLKRVARCQNLRELRFGGPEYRPFGPTDCTPLAKLKKLEKLNIYRSNLTDASIKGVGALTRLTVLNVNGNAELSDVAMSEIAPLKELRLLQIAETKVTSNGMKVLAGMENLTDLYLSKTAIDDAGLESLVELKSLRYLELRATKITDAGLQTILTFKADRLIVAMPMSVSKEAIDMAGKRRPKMLFSR